MSAPETQRRVRFYDHEGREIGQPVIAVGRVVDGRHEEHYANAVKARDDWRALQQRLRDLDAVAGRSS